MRIITVSGSHSGVGKTRVVTELLARLKGWSALKVTLSRKGACPRKKPCGNCDSLRRKFYIITKKSVLLQKGKDTERFKNAGAKEVMWLRATPRGLKEGLREALYRLKKAKGLIIEGTSVLKYMRPHLSIFIAGNAKKIRPPAVVALKKADVVLRVEK